MAVVWVGQEHLWGCGAACMAMLTGCTYKQAQSYFSHDFATGGLDTFVWDQYLAEHGYAVARKYPYCAIHNRKRDVWPPEPFANMHLCLVRAAGGQGHLVVMLNDGAVLDPVIPEPRTINEYVQVDNVAGVVELLRVTGFS